MLFCFWRYSCYAPELTLKSCSFSVSCDWAITSVQLSSFGCMDSTQGIYGPLQLTAIPVLCVVRKETLRYPSRGDLKAIGTFGDPQSRSEREWGYHRPQPCCQRETRTVWIRQDRRVQRFLWADFDNHQPDTSLILTKIILEALSPLFGTFNTVGTLVSLTCNVLENQIRA